MNNTVTRMSEEISRPLARWSVGGLFIEALAMRDFTGLANCFESRIRMRAMLPRGPIELIGSDQVVGWFRSLFGSAEDLELADGTVGEFGTRLYLRWRISLMPGEAPGPRRVVEQHAFATTDSGAYISALDLLCSGFIAESVVTQSSKRGASCPVRP
jgi:hypothetical protein